MRLVTATDVAAMYRVRPRVPVNTTPRPIGQVLTSDQLRIITQSGASIRPARWIPPTHPGAPAAAPGPASGITFPSRAKHASGVATFLPMDTLVNLLDHYLRRSSKTLFMKEVLVVDQNFSSFTQSPSQYDRGLIRIDDHHGAFGDGREVNSTMKLLDRFEAALQAAQGDVAAAIAKLNIRWISTDNLGDGAWGVWIAQNQERVLADADLRTLIRAATHFEDFTAFGANYDRQDAAVTLQAAIFQRYGEILQQHKIYGSDRLTQVQIDPTVVMQEAVDAIETMLTDTTARNRAATQFWAGVDDAISVARTARVSTHFDTDGNEAVTFYDLGKLTSFPIFQQWLAIPQVNPDLNLQVTVMDVTKPDQVETRRLFIIAIPNGRQLPSRLGLTDVMQELNRQEAALAAAIKASPMHWFGRDTVILSLSSLNAPGTVADVLMSGAFGLFNPEEISE